ncbi:MAG: 3' terminal RNA ribose 2'-O-methyltransferase Hen1 [Zavarzinella sp.]
MHLTITVHMDNPGDLGYLLQKHPARVQQFQVSRAVLAHLFFSNQTATQITAHLVLDIDPILLVNMFRENPVGKEVFENYVNDRPYVSSSLMSVAIAQVLGSALNGQCKQRPELVEQPFRLEAKLSTVPCRGGPDRVHELFAPLGYELELVQHLMDDNHPEYGVSPYVSITMRAVTTVRELLSHLYILIPVLDVRKHYWIGEDEIDKIKRHGAGWLENHPHYEQIVRRYLGNHTRLVNAAIESSESEEGTEERQDAPAEVQKDKLYLHDLRLDTITHHLQRLGIQRLVDMGCGEGKLLKRLLALPQITEVVGVDYSVRALTIAQKRCRHLVRSEANRLQLLQGSATFCDERLQGYDALVAVEVIEHLEPTQVGAFEAVTFRMTAPRHVLITTPNREYNQLYQQLPEGKLRHTDHRFEWTRGEFEQWVNRVSEQFGYTSEIHPIGPEDERVGAPSQMAIFTRLKINEAG